jgi:leucyl/phenylalanyl-tRNA--protein transferase
MRLVQLSRHNIAFPSPEGALREPNGLLALGGDLSPARLLMAYQRGIFPGFPQATPFCGGRPIRVPCCGLRIFTSAVA